MVFVDMQKVIGNMSVRVLRCANSIAGAHSSVPFALDCWKHNVSDNPLLFFSFLDFDNCVLRNLQNHHWCTTAECAVL
jgi:hypothetical protein